MNSNKEIEGTDCIKTLVLTQLKLYEHYVYWRVFVAIDYSQSPKKESPRWYLGRRIYLNELIDFAKLQEIIGIHFVSYNDLNVIGLVFKCLIIVAHIALTR